MLNPIGHLDHPEAFSLLGYKSLGIQLGNDVHLPRKNSFPLKSDWLKFTRHSSCNLYCDKRITKVHGNQIQQLLFSDIDKKRRFSFTKTFTTLGILAIYTSKLNTIYTCKEDEGQQHGIVTIDFNNK